MSYLGRFAPSPTGPLHLGSLSSALASWLDAKAHQGTWIIRIEDIDATRCKPHWSQWILNQLSACGLQSDGPIVYQSNRTELYFQNLVQLMPTQRLYLCGCSRLQILQAQARSTSKPPLSNLIYPGTCRSKAALERQHYTNLPQEPWGTSSQTQHAKEYFHFWKFSKDQSVRITVPDVCYRWCDRRLGEQQQNPSHEVGDFVLKTRDNHFSYQWAVVIDDIAQGVSDVVRGEDLADNTPRQLMLYDLLKHTRPRYLHIPLVLTQEGKKLSKQTQAPALDPLQSSLDLNRAALHLGLTPSNHAIPERLLHWVQEWSALYKDPRHSDIKIG